MKKYMVIIVCLVLLGVGYLFYLNTPSNQEGNQEGQLKKDVISYLEKKGYSKSDYTKPEYVINKSLKGDQSRNVKIIFNKDKNYEYFYIKENGKIKLFYAFNKKTSEQEFSKKEP